MISIEDFKRNLYYVKMLKNVLMENVRVKVTLWRVAVETLQCLPCVLSTILRYQGLHKNGF